MYPMKHLPLLIAALCLTACGSGNKEIEEVAYNYCVTTSNYQMDEAEQYATPETIKETFSMARFFISQIDPAYIAADTPATITIKKVHQTSDTTAYAVYHKVTPQKNFTDTLQLRRRDSRWLVHILPQKHPRRPRR